jgi:hypothetical protein
MPVTAIDPRCALVVIDLQKGIVFPRIVEIGTTADILTKLS